MERALAITIALAAVGMVRADDAPPVNFEEHIVPILNEYCLDCHRGSRAKNGLRLDSLISVLEGGSGGASVVPGDASGSLLYQVVAHTREPFMPYKDDKLQDDLIATIRTWIDAGAPESASSRPVVARRDVRPVTIEPGASNEPAGAPAMPVDLRREPYWWSHRASAITALAASPWAPLVAVAGHGQIALYHSETSELLGVLEFEGGKINTLTFSRNGALLLAGGGRGAAAGYVIAWDVATGDRVLELGDEPDAVLAADMTNDHQRVALGGPDGVVRVYATATGSLLYELTKHTDWVTAVAFSPDGALLATGDRAGGVWVWESDTSREFHALPAHVGRVTGLEWRLDSNVLATAGEDGAIRLHEMENGAQVKAWSSHGGVLGIRFLRDGRLATCGRDGSARLWDANGAEQRSFGPAADISTSVCVIHDGSRIVVGDWTGAVSVFALADGASFGSLRANPTTIAQREVEASERALGTLREQVSLREARMREADAERARRAEAARAARAAVDAARLSAEALEGESNALEAASADAQPSRELVSGLAASRAALDIAQRDLAIAEAECARAEAEMLTAQQAAVDAATAVADASDAERTAALARQADADRMLTGAAAVAQLAAESAARLRVERARCSAEHAGRQAVLAPRQARENEARGAADAAREEAERARAAATAQDERMRELEAAAGAAEGAARVADTALTAARAALARGEERARAAAARWSEKRAAIAAAGGRVE